MIAILTDKPNVGKELARIVGAYRPENGFMSGSGYIPRITARQCSAKTTSRWYRSVSTSW